MNAPGSRAALEGGLLLARELRSRAIFEAVKQTVNIEGMTTGSDLLFP